MRNVFCVLFLSFILASCNKKNDSEVAGVDCQSDESATSTDCAIVPEPSSSSSNVDTSSGAITGGATTDPDVVVSVPVIPDAPIVNNGLPNLAYTFDSNIFFVGTTVTEQEKFDRAIEIIKKVIATEEFRSKVLNHTYNGVKTFVDNGGNTNAQIYQKVLDAAEKLFPVKNNAIDMEVELYYANTNVIGYTLSSSKRIWVNTKYFATNTVTSVASNLFHEWLHKVGFGHAVNYSVSRDYSVPYAVGRIIGSIGKQFD
jgi:hypothetical protein